MKCYDEESKAFFIEKRAELLVHEVYLYQKYFKKENESIKQIYQSLTDYIYLSENDLKKIFSKAEKILLKKYNIKRVK